MTRQSSVLSALALAYEASLAGRTGQGERDFQIDYRELLRRAGATEGEALARDERRKLQRLIACPGMASERPELEAMLAAGHKGAFEQESLGRPRSPRWPFY